MIFDSRQPAYVRMHKGAFYVYLPDELERSGELVSDSDDIDDEDSFEYVLKVVHDTVEVANLIAPKYRLARPDDGGFYVGSPLPEELLDLVKVQLDFWPMPPLIQLCFRQQLSAEDGPLG